MYCCPEADAYKRRGQIRAAKSLVADALSDLGQAIQLDNSDPDCYYQVDTTFGRYLEYCTIYHRGISLVSVVSCSMEVNITLLL